MAVDFCPTCGAKLDDGAKFCIECGQAVKVASTGAGVSASPPAPHATAPTSAVPPPPPPASAPGPAKKPSGGVPWLPIAILLAGVVAVAIVLIFVRGGNPPAGEALSQAQPQPAAPAAGTVDSTAAVPTETAATGTITGNEPAFAATPAGQPADTLTQPPVSQPASNENVAMVEPPTPAPKPTEPPFEEVFRCRKYAKFDVDPEEAEIYINGKHIGKADDWDNMGGGKLWEFEHEGVYYAHLVRKGYHSAWVKIEVSEEAKHKEVSIDTKLKKEKD
jgi:hypothetical protein